MHHAMLLAVAQVVVRLDDEVAAAIDRLVADGVVASRSDAVRRGLDRLLDEHHRSEIGRQIVEGYRRVPQTAEEIRWADRAAAAMIAEEPW